MTWWSTSFFKFIFPLPFIPPYPLLLPLTPLPTAVTTLLSVPWVLSLFFSFLLSPSIPPNRPPAVSLLSMSVSLLFLEREEGREKERERNTDVWEKHQSIASPMCPNWGQGPQPMHVPWLGVEPVTVHLSEWHPTPWATLIKANLVSILLVCSVCSLGSTYEWNHMVIVFVWLAYFT